MKFVDGEGRKIELYIRTESGMDIAEDVFDDARIISAPGEERLYFVDDIEYIIDYANEYSIEDSPMCVYWEEI